MVREGIMNREEGLEKIYAPENSEMVQYSEKIMQSIKTQSKH